MVISYEGLWKKLAEKNLQRRNLEKDLNLSSATIAKLGKGETVSLKVLVKICKYLKCDLGDVASLN